jgi:hypothetical protein
MTRQRRALLIAGLGVGFCVAGTPAGAQIFESVGVRAAGMAGAFVAVADDATATYWNPAGLATGAFFSLTLDLQRADAFPRGRTGPNAGGAGLDGSAFQFGLSFPALGLSYYRTRSSEVRHDTRIAEVPEPGREDQRLEAQALGSLITHHTGISLVQSLVDRVAVGATLKFVRGIATLEPAEPGPLPEQLDLAAMLVGRASNTVDADLGAMAEFGVARAGFVVRNVRAPRFETIHGDRLRLERQVRAGLAIMPRHETTLSVDLDLTRTTTAMGDRRSLAAGVEQWVHRRWGVRGGLRVNTVEAARPVGAAGASVTARRWLWIDGQVTYGHRDGDRGWGLSTRIDF